MRCALLQINTKVGDVSRNAELIAARAGEAAARGAHLALTPEMALTGCPPGDLLLYQALAEEAEQASLALAHRLAEGPALVLGTIGRNPCQGSPLLNQALFLSGGRVAATHNKRRLSAVFDEARYFETGKTPTLVEFQGRRLALTIGDDLWDDNTAPGSEAADVLINIAASPYMAGSEARARLTALARRNRVHLLRVNLVGGNDELIFDGRSLWAGPNGEKLARGFAEDMVLVDLDHPESLSAPENDSAPEAEYWQALTLGLADYCAKLGFRRVVLGLSGGLDSALVAAIAVNALGPENVRGLIMPSPYSSSHSLKDALALKGNLKIRTQTLPIRTLMNAYSRLLAAPFAGRDPDVTEENIQARIRGNLLMAYANKFGEMLLSTGNKSEIAVGYCTLYGDMCGGLSVIGDLYKTEVLRLSRWLNAKGEVIPQNTLDKPPSAELRPNQTDQDSLPPYEELDRILLGLLEERRGVKELIADGFDAAVVGRVAALVHAAEFKRRQAAPVLKLKASSFGAGWRMPIAKNFPSITG